MGTRRQCLDRVDSEISGKDQQNRADDDLRYPFEAVRAVRVACLRGEAPGQCDGGGGVNGRVEPEAE